MSSRSGSGRMLMLRLAHLWILSLQFLQLCNADDIPCTVTQDAEGTLYSVPEFQATKCHFYWTNISGGVLANHEDKMNDRMKNIRRLRTSGCLKHVHYKRDCLSEGGPREANCSINCTGNVESLSGGDPVTTHATLPPETKPTHLTAVVPHIHWIVPVVNVLVLLLLLVVVLCYKRRRQICRADGNTNGSVV